MKNSLDTSTVQSYDLTKGLQRINNAWTVEDNISSSSDSSQRKRNYSLVTKMVAEFLGDFTFVFVGTMQAVMMTGSGKQGLVADNLVHAALAHGLTIFVLVAALGHISGGHFNPAVSWAITASGKMPFYHLPFYWFAQFLGGFCGSLYSVLILTRQQLDASLAGTTLLSPNNTWWETIDEETSCITRCAGYLSIHNVVHFTAYELSDEFMFAFWFVAFCGCWTKRPYINVLTTLALFYLFVQSFTWVLSTHHRYYSGALLTCTKEQQRSDPSSCSTYDIMLLISTVVAVIITIIASTLSFIRLWSDQPSFGEHTIGPESSGRSAMISVFRNSFDN